MSGKGSGNFTNISVEKGEDSGWHRFVVARKLSERFHKNIKIH